MNRLPPRQRPREKLRRQRSKDQPETPPLPPSPDSKQMARQGLRVGRTAVGKGLFATKRIVDGSCVGEIQGRVITDDMYVSRYSFDLDNGTQLEPAPPFRFVNHSCEPNCAFESFDFAARRRQVSNPLPSNPLPPNPLPSESLQGGPSPDTTLAPPAESLDSQPPPPRKLLLFAICDIAIGQELTIDYNWPASFAIPCHCHARRCRGWIVSPEELPELLSLELQDPAMQDAKMADAELLWEAG
ncbi:MAG: SET domain-containing protein-lysine N-methyltransferase [Planctomycetales bacterium]|nr:SET domain-containing protein-lysine N-methyltransferase [Planctomycetales bacterium]